MTTLFYPVSLPNPDAQMGDGFSVAATIPSAVFIAMASTACLTEPSGTVMTNHETASVAYLAYGLATASASEATQDVDADLSPEPVTGPMLLQWGRSMMGGDVSDMLDI